MYRYRHTNTHTYTYIYIHIYIYIYIYIHTHIYIYTYTQTHMHTYIHTHTHIHIYIYTRTCIVIALELKPECLRRNLARLRRVNAKNEIRVGWPTALRILADGHGWQIDPLYLMMLVRSKCDGFFSEPWSCSRVRCGDIQMDGHVFLNVRGHSGIDLTKVTYIPLRVADTDSDTHVHLVCLGGGRSHWQCMPSTFEVHGSLGVMPASANLCAQSHFQLFDYVRFKLAL